MSKPRTIRRPHAPTDARLPRWARRGVVAGTCVAALAGPLAAWAQSGTSYSESLFVDATAIDGAYTMGHLASGTRYHFTVTGTYQFHGGKSQGDAECTTDDGYNWRTNTYGNERFDLLIDGQAVQWTPAAGLFGCDTLNHSYSYDFVPTADGSAVLKVNGEDNVTQRSYSGRLQVTITGPKLASDPSTPPGNNGGSTGGGTQGGGTAPAPGNPSSDPRPVAGPGQPTASPTPPDQPAAAYDGNGNLDALADVLLSDQPHTTGSANREVALDAGTHPRSPDGSLPSPLVLLPALAIAAAAARPRQTLALANRLLAGASDQFGNTHNWRPTVVIPAPHTPAQSPTPVPPSGASILERSVLGVPSSHSMTPVRPVRPAAQGPATQRPRRVLQARPAANEQTEAAAPVGPVAPTRVMLRRKR